MKTTFINLIVILSLISIFKTTFALVSQTASGLRNGKWKYAWQNNDHQLCIPETIKIITNNTTEVTVEYHYPWRVRYDLCPKKISRDYYVYWNITSYSASEVLHDINGHQFSYNADTNSILLLANETSFWFQLETHEIISAIQHTPGALSGYWDYQSYETNTEPTCCHPDQLLFFPYYHSTLYGYNPGFVYNAYYTGQGQLKCSENITHKTLHFFNSNLTTISLVDDLVSPTFSISFSPLTSLTSLTWVSSSNVPCSITYRRAANFTPIEGFWYHDWQSEYGYPDHYRAEVVSVGDIEYNHLSYSEGSNVNCGFLVEVIPDRYYEHSVNQTYLYDRQTDTLRTETKLYSRNGSLFSSVPFMRLWGFSYPISDVENCCLPKYVYMPSQYEDLNFLDVVFAFPDGYLTNPSCQEMSAEIQGGFVTTTMTVARPSIAQVVWTDKLNTTISFANIKTLSELLVSFDNQCSFIMLPLSLPSVLPPVAWEY